MWNFLNSKASDGMITSTIQMDSAFSIKFLHLINS